MKKNQITNFIKERKEYSQTAGQQYYTNTDGDIFHRERVIELAKTMLAYFDLSQNSQKQQALVETIIKNQSIADFDCQALFQGNNQYLLDELLLEDGNAQTLNFNQQRIYCSYHLGSYRLIVGYLLAKGVNVALLVTNDVVKQQVSSILKLHSDFVEGHPNCGSIEIINAESFQGLNDAADFYQQGGSLLIYIDGNSGVGGMNRQDNNLITIPFLNRHIKARRGVAFLSYLLSAEIRPVFIHNNQNGTRSVIVKSGINPLNKLDKKQYIKETTTALYQILAEEISLNITAWEGWLYIEKSVHTLDSTTGNSGHNVTYSPNINLQFNDAEYTVLAYPTANVLMNVKKLRYQILSANSARAIRFAKENRNVHHVVSPSCIKSLMQQNILIAQGA